MAEPEADGRCLRLESHSERLLPRIPDEITLGVIASKLSWRDFHILSSVSRAWCHAIESREVYNARVRSTSTEALLLLRDIGSQKIGLYCIRDNSFHDLPPIPFLRGGIPSGSEVVSLDGKVYVIGGVREMRTKRRGKEIQTINTVYELDLAGQRQWKKCASMIVPRQYFGCGVIDGKIYAFGGLSSHPKVYNCGSEVYDPKANVWSPISSMISLRFYHRVETLGEEFFVHGGYYLDQDDYDAHGELADGRIADFLEVYHPVTDVWTVVHEGGEFGRNNQATLWQNLTNLPQWYEIEFISPIQL